VHDKHGYVKLRGPALLVPALAHAELVASTARDGLLAVAGGHVVRALLRTPLPRSPDFPQLFPQERRNAVEIHADTSSQNATIFAPDPLAHLPADL
jgi:hypothetical protein